MHRRLLCHNWSTAFRSFLWGVDGGGRKGEGGREREGEGGRERGRRRGRRVD